MDKVVMFDMDMTLCDSSIAKGLHYLEARKMIPLFNIYDGITELINHLIKNNVQVWVVSGNVEGNIKEFIKHFNLPIKHISGYRFRMTTHNLKRKIAVIKNAMKELPDDADITYIGDEDDDETACNMLGIKFIKADWNNITPLSLRDIY